MILIGRLTKEVELKYTQNGTAVAKFTLAVDRKFSKEKTTDFISCQAWSKTAEFIAQYFQKGQMMACEGEIQTSNYEKEDGSKVYQTVVNVSQVEFCGSKNTEKESVTEQFASIFNGEEIKIETQDLPFI